MSEWLSNKVPGAESADVLRRFFDLHAGFLTAGEPETLNEALQPELQRVEAQSDPQAPLRTPASFPLAARAPRMSPDQLQAPDACAEPVTARDPKQDTDG